MTEQRAFRKLVEDMAERMYSDDYIRRYRPFFPLLALLQKPKDPKRFVTLAEACLTCDTYGELEKIRVPVLILGGGEDRIVTAEASVEMAEKMNGELYLYDHLGHSAYEEARDFNQRIYCFLRGEIA